MNLHEYQAKQIFADYNLPVSKNLLVKNSKEVKKAFNVIGGDKWVMKTQVHAGGRGKVGGVKLIIMSKMVLNLLINGLEKD